MSALTGVEGAAPGVPALPLQKVHGDEEQVSYELSDVLRDFARTMVTDFSIEAILNHLVLRMLNILPITAAGVTLISPASDPRYVAASDEAALRFEALQTTLGEGPCLLAHRIGRAVSVPDLRQDNKFPFFAPVALLKAWRRYSRSRSITVTARSVRSICTGIRRAA